MTLDTGVFRTSMHPNELHLWEKRSLLKPKTQTVDSSWKSQIEWEGSKTLRSAWNPDGGVRLEQELDIRVSGKLRPGWSMEARIQDRDIPLSIAGQTSTLEEMERLRFDLYGPQLLLYLGDLPWLWEMKDPWRYQAEPLGFWLQTWSHGDLAPDQISQYSSSRDRQNPLIDATNDSVYRTGFQLASGIERALVQSEWIILREGIWGTYPLQSQGLGIVPNSEEVWYQGRKLERLKEYRIDVGSGGLQFLPAFRLRGGERVWVRFRIWSAQNRQSLWSLSQQNRWGPWGVRWAWAGRMPYQNSMNLDRGIDSSQGLNPEQNTRVDSLSQGPRSLDFMHQSLGTEWKWEKGAHKIRWRGHGLYRRDADSNQWDKDSILAFAGLSELQFTSPFASALRGQWNFEQSLRSKAYQPWTPYAMERHWQQEWRLDSAPQVPRFWENRNRWSLQPQQSIWSFEQAQMGWSRGEELWRLGMGLEYKDSLWNQNWIWRIKGRTQDQRVQKWWGIGQQSLQSSWGRPYHLLEIESADLQSSQGNILMPQSWLSQIGWEIPWAKGVWTPKAEWQEQGDSLQRRGGGIEWNQIRDAWAHQADFWSSERRLYGVSSQSHRFLHTLRTLSQELWSYGHRLSYAQSQSWILRKEYRKVPEGTGNVLFDSTQKIFIENVEGGDYRFWAYVRDTTQKPQEVSEWSAQHQMEWEWGYLLGLNEGLWADLSSGWLLEWDSRDSTSFDVPRFWQIQSGLSSWRRYVQPYTKWERAHWKALSIWEWLDVKEEGEFALESSEQGMRQEVQWNPNFWTFKGEWSQRSVQRPTVIWTQKQPSLGVFWRWHPKWKTGTEQAWIQKSGSDLLGAWEANTPLLSLSQSWEPNPRSLFSSQVSWRNWSKSRAALPYEVDEGFAEGSAWRGLTSWRYQTQHIQSDLRHLWRQDSSRGFWQQWSLSIQAFF